MAYEKFAYDPVTDQADPIRARLNHIEDGLSDADGGEGTPVSFNDLTDVPTTFPPTVGTTATAAAAGNHNHAVTASAASGLAAAANIQALAVALSVRIAALDARIAALETPAP